MSGSRLRSQGYGSCDIGLVRQKNEDSILIRSDLGLYAVADGMGGHAGGEVASRLTLETLESAVADVELPPETTPLREIAAEAHRRVLERATRESTLRGMGTTLSAILVGPDHLQMAHVGDSRIYRLRGGELIQLSKDHSLVADKVRAGLLSFEEAQMSPYRNILTRALGTQTRIEIDFEQFEMQSGDRYLLCSDGLWSHVDDGMLCFLLQSEEAPTEVCAQLVSQALEQGGRDNISVILVEIFEGDPDA